MREEIRANKKKKWYQRWRWSRRSEQRGQEESTPVSVSVQDHGMRRNGKEMQPLVNYKPQWNPFVPISRVLSDAIKEQEAFQYYMDVYYMFEHDIKQIDDKKVRKIFQNDLKKEKKRKELKSEVDQSNIISYVEKHKKNKDQSAYRSISIEQYKNEIRPYLIKYKNFLIQTKGEIAQVLSDNTEGAEDAVYQYIYEWKEKAKVYSEAESSLKSVNITKGVNYVYNRFNTFMMNHREDTMQHPGGAPVSWEQSEEEETGTERAIEWTEEERYLQHIIKSRERERQEQGKNKQNSSINMADVKMVGKIIMKQLQSARESDKKNYETALKEYQELTSMKIYAHYCQLADKIKIQYEQYANVDQEECKTQSKLVKEAAQRFYFAEEAIEKRKEIRKAREKYFKSWKENAEELKSLLTHYRKIGTQDQETLKGHIWKDADNAYTHTEGYIQHSNKVLSTVRDVMEYYPTEWLESSRKFGAIHLKEETSEGAGGAYNYLTGEISVKYIKMAAGELHQVGFHELGHRFEHVNPLIMQLGKEFYDQRTEGEEIKNGKKDGGFIDPYIGKVCDIGSEVISVGFEYAFTDPVGLWKDEDYASLIYGILVYV